MQRFKNTNEFKVKNNIKRNDLLCSIALGDASFRKSIVVNLFL